MNQIRLSELLPGKALKWPEFFVRNIPNIRLESRVIPESQCFRYLHKKGILKVFTTVNQRVLGSSQVAHSALTMKVFLKSSIAFLRIAQICWQVPFARQ